MLIYWIFAHSKHSCTVSSWNRISLEVIEVSVLITFNESILICVLWKWFLSKWIRSNDTHSVSLRYCSQAYVAYLKRQRDREWNLLSEHKRMLSYFTSISVLFLFCFSFCVSVSIPLNWVEIFSPHDTLKRMWTQATVYKFPTICVSVHCICNGNVLISRRNARLTALSSFCSCCLSCTKYRFLLFFIAPTWTLKRCHVYIAIKQASTSVDAK